MVGGRRPGRRQFARGKNTSSVQIRVPEVDFAYTALFRDESKQGSSSNAFEIPLAVHIIARSHASCPNLSSFPGTQRAVCTHEKRRELHTGHRYCRWRVGTNDFCTQSCDRKHRRSFYDRIGEVAVALTLPWRSIHFSPGHETLLGL